LAPKRVEGLNGVQVAATATCNSHRLVAGEDGVVWGFGDRMSMSFGDPDAAPLNERCPIPAAIPSLRVRARKSPDVLPFR